MNNKHFSYKRLFLTILVLLNSFAVLHISFSLMGGFTNIYNGTIGAVFRIVFEKFSSPILFSLAELLLIVSPLLIIVVLVAVIQSSRKTKQRIIAILLVLSVFVCSIYGLFVLTFAAGYSSDTIEQRSSLE